MDASLSRTDDDHLLITIRGEADLATADALLLRLMVLVGTATAQISLDLSQITFIDCSGLRALSATDRHVRSAGGSIRVVAVSPEVARLFELIGSHGVLPRILAPPFLTIPRDVGMPDTLDALDVLDTLCVLGQAASADAAPLRAGARELADSTEAY
jgi:anti-sigma B factor antagonist